MNKDEIIRVWITKYALTFGPYETDVEWDPDMPRMVVQRGESGSWPQHFYDEGKDWHRTREAALARCEAMRKAKLASMDKQRRKLEALRFEAM